MFITLQSVLAIHILRYGQVWLNFLPGVVLTLLAFLSLLKILETVRYYNYFFSVNLKFYSACHLEHLQDLRNIFFT